MPNKGRGRRTVKGERRLKTLRAKHPDSVFKQWGSLGGRPRKESKNDATQ